MRASAREGARILGTNHRTLPELATFANGVMARYLDGNDVYPGGGGHPSDVIAPMLALADTFARSGLATVGAIALGYDVHYALFPRSRLRQGVGPSVLYRRRHGRGGGKTPRLE